MFLATAGCSPRPALLPGHECVSLRWEGLCADLAIRPNLGVASEFGTVFHFDNMEEPQCSDTPSAPWTPSSLTFSSPHAVLRAAKKQEGLEGRAWRVLTVHVEGGDQDSSFKPLD